MKTPENIINLIKRKRVSFSNKALKYLYSGKYSLADISNSIILGNLKKKEKDEQGKSKYKYTIIGPALNGDLIYTCGKILKLEGKNYFFITIHKAD